MNKLRRDISFFIRIHGLTSEQVGAGLNNTKEVIFNDHKVLYNHFLATWGDHFTVFYSGREDACRCHSIALKVSDGEAMLLTLKRNNDDNIIDLNEPSKDVIQVAFQYAQKKHGTDFTLEDDFYMYYNKIRYPLADFHFLCTGQTWFESFLPIKLKSSFDNTCLERHRVEIRKNKWSDVLNKLLLKKVPLDIIDAEGIDVDEEGSAMKVMCRLQDYPNLERLCDFLSDHLWQIVYASGKPQFVCSDWICS